MKITPVLSLGAGTQSTDLLLRALRDEFDIRPEYAVFADLGNEPKGVYRYLDGLIPFVRIEYNQRMTHSWNILSKTKFLICCSKFV